MHVRDDPKFFTSRAMHGGKAKAKGKGAPPQYKGELKGDLLIRYLWTQVTESIHNVHVVNTDAVSYKYKTPEKCLDTADRDNKKNYLHACIKESQHFTPFVASVDGLLGVEVEATLKCIASHLATKWKGSYS